MSPVATTAPAAPRSNESLMASGAFWIKFNGTASPEAKILTRFNDRVSQTVTSPESSSTAASRPLGENAAALIGLLVGPRTRTAAESIGVADAYASVGEREADRRGS